MNTTSPLLGCSLLIAALAAGGCATTPQPGYLLYYDAGDIWNWNDDSGWSYLGAHQIRLARDHRPEPRFPFAPGHEPKPGPGRHVPPFPGRPPSPGACYYFVGKDGTVLRSPNGTSFTTVAHTEADGRMVPGSAPSAATTVFHGTLDHAGTSFRVAADPVGQFRQRLGSVLTGDSHPPSASPSSPHHYGSSGLSGEAGHSGASSHGGDHGSYSHSTSGGGSHSYSGGGGGGGGGGHFSGGGGGGGGGHSSGGGSSGGSSNNHSH
jgi:hypothetical protein